MNLLELAKAINTQQVVDTKSILIWGDARTGKTRLAATVAKVPTIKRVYWFDLENGIETLVRMANSGILTPEEAAKIIVFKIQDLPDHPYAYETVVKALTSKAGGIICSAHTRFNCPTCTLAAKAKGGTTKIEGTPFNFKELGASDCAVIDSGTQLTTSIINQITAGQDIDYKLLLDDYGALRRILNDIMTIIQSGKTNVIMVTHSLLVEGKQGDPKKGIPAVPEKVYPAIGTISYSRQVAKFFGHTIYVQIKGARHVGGSSTCYAPGIMTGSRSGWQVEKLDSLDLSKVWTYVGPSEPTHEKEEEGK